MNNLLTPELRQKCLDKIKSLHQQLNIPQPPELLEKMCFDKSNNRYEDYIKFIHALIARTKNQHPQPQMQMPGTMMSNYQSNNIAGTSFNVTTAAADPLNALQNLTVSAGQSAQLMAQQNMRLNSTAFNNQIRQRSLVQGSINRPIDPLSATKSSLSQQLVQPQIPSNVVITNSNMINVNSARISTNPISMKPEICVNQNSGQQSLMLPPYPMDSCNSLMSSSQVSPMASVGKITPYSSTPSSQYQSSLPTQHSSQIIQPTNNLFPNGAPIRRTVNSQQNLRPPSIISDEEAKKVKEEVKRLKEKYFKKLTIILENPKNVSDDEIKVWTVLKTLLENPDSIQKPLSMRHISKIEQHLMKAEQHVLQKCSNQTTNIHLEKLHPNTSQIVAQSQCRTTVQKPIVNYDEKSMKTRPAIGFLQAQAAEIRATKVNWASYLQGQIITADSFKFIMEYDRAPSLEARNDLIRKNPHNAAKLFIFLLNTISLETTTQYLLTMIDDMLQEDKQKVEIFREYFMKVKENMMDVFFCFLRRENKFIVYQASRIIAKIACWSSQLMETRDLQYFLRWIQEQFFISDNEYIQTVARNLQMMLRIRQYRKVFIECNGIETIINSLNGKLNTQIQYQLIFCLWCLSFDADSIPQIIKTPRLISVVSDIIRQTEREKIIRVSLALFRYLLEKLSNQTQVREIALDMVQCKVMKQLELFQQKDYSHDPELTDDLAYLQEKLSSSVRDVSSMEEYAIELKSGRLEWSPVHKAEKFWRENADKFLDKNYELLKILVKLLETNKDPLVLQVAIHDVGEFVSHYPRGKQVIEKLGGKQLVMELLNDNDPNVRYHALLSLQKIMVHNWEYLGKQVPNDSVPQSNKANS